MRARDETTSKLDHVSRFIISILAPTSAPNCIPTVQDGPVQLAYGHANERGTMTAMKQTTLDGSDPKDHGNPGKRGASAKDEDASSASEPPPSKRARKNQGKHEVEEQSKEAPRLSEGVLERGTIHFVYKPKVEQDDPSSIDDISK